LATSFHGIFFGMEKDRASFYRADIHCGFVMTKILDFFIWVKGNIPTWVEIKQGTHIFLMIVGGGLLLALWSARLPILGWDWYYFFTAHNPDYNLYSKASAYPPFASMQLKYFHGSSLAAIPGDPQLYFSGNCGYCHLESRR
jgi:hypothetical protein